MSFVKQTNPCQRINAVDASNYQSDRKSIIGKKIDNSLIISCPNCDGGVLVNRNEINCKIFRHGIVKSTFTQINPHEIKQKCDKFSKENKIYGCGKPFRLRKINGKWNVFKCGYI